MDNSMKKEMYDNYQPWVIKTYGDLSRTKTITLKKRARILKILRGEEQLSAENSKFRFWVRNKGFRMKPPEDYVAKPADRIIVRNGPEDDADDLYVPTGHKDVGSEYKKVAIVENFFDIIYGVHVEIDRKNGKHAGQKRTYRTITETYSFLPREAVTKFLLNCYECQRRPHSPALKKILTLKGNNMKILPQLLENSVRVFSGESLAETDFSETTGSSNCEQNSPENLCKRDENGDENFSEYCNKNLVHTSTPVRNENSNPLETCRKIVVNLKKVDTSSESEKSNGRGKSAVAFGVAGIHLNQVRFEESTGSDTSDSSFEHFRKSKKNHPRRIQVENEKTVLQKGLFKCNRMNGRGKRSLEISPGRSPEFEGPCFPRSSGFPICYPLPLHDGKKTFVSGKETAFEKSCDPVQRKSLKEEVTAVAEVETPEEETAYPGTKEAEKLKMMLLAWSGGRNGERLPEDVQDEASQIWAGYHSALSMSKQTPPIRSSPTQETGSVHDETSSSGNKDDDDDEEEECEEKIDPLKYDPERLKAFNMFVRLFVDENLDRIVPISKQPKEKIQAIIDSCTRQFPEFSERARKRIRTYLKSCRRNKRTREGSAAWEPVRSRPTPAHLTSVQAEQILAQACENESHNAKRMRLGLEPVTQPMPGITTDTSTTVRSQTNNEGTRERDHYTTPVSSTNAIDKHSVKHEPNSDSVSPVQNKSCSLEALAMASANSLSPNLLNGSAPPSSVSAAAAVAAAAAAAPTAMYRPNFSQAFQRAASGTYITPGLFSLPCSLTNGTRPTDLSMKNKPLLTHKLNPSEMTAVRQLITGYRESAAFLLRSADELEQLLRSQ